MKNKNLRSKNQIGFREKSRTADHIFTLKTIIDQYKQKSKKVFTAFIEIEIPLLFRGSNLSPFLCNRTKIFGKVPFLNIRLKSFFHKNLNSRDKDHNSVQKQIIEEFVSLKNNFSMSIFGKVPFFNIRLKSF
jgi:hypothetical protein